MDMIYQQGNIWWIKYYRNGKYYRESSKSNKKMVAKKLLDRREGEISQGKLPGIQFEKSPLRSWPINFCGITGSTEDIVR